LTRVSRWQSGAFSRPHCVRCVGEGRLIAVHGEIAMGRPSRVGALAQELPQEESPPWRGFQAFCVFAARNVTPETPRSEEHTSELQSLMRISSAVFCLKK